MLKKHNKVLFFLLFAVQSIVAQVPLARTDYDTADINTTLTVPAPGVLANDTVAEDEEITVSQFSVNNRFFSAGETANFAQGSITIASDGSYTFIPRAGYTGNVATISYTITNGDLTSRANLFLTVEFTDNLLEMGTLSSCNQGFNSSGEYKIVYSLTLRNKSTARDTHENSLIRSIDLTNDLQATFGAGCVVNVDQIGASTFGSPTTYDYVNDQPYPRDFDASAINSGFTSISSNSVFNSNAINNFILYPGQTIIVSYCVTVNANCGQSTIPTQSGSGIDYTNTTNVTSTKGSDSNSNTLTDFHTTEAVVTAGLIIPEFHTNSLNPPGLVNSDGTYDFVNTVVITNEGTSAAENINYNMGLGNFSGKVTFTEIRVEQVSGPNVAVNPNFDGFNQTTLLLPNNNLPAGETIILEVFYLTGLIQSTNTSVFSQPTNSQTQSSLDGFNAFDSNNKRNFSFVTWKDDQGEHLDRYYSLNAVPQSVSSDLYCNCTTVGMQFSFTAFSNTNTVITNRDPEPNDILEHEEVTFQITVENTSPAVELDNLRLVDNLDNVCTGNVLSVTEPRIVSSTATTNPNLNLSYNGTSNTNLFDGTSGLLKARERITVEFTVLFNETCVGTNEAFFSGRDPLDRFVSSSSAVEVSASSDTDNDGVTDDIDIDDDNDTIPDVLEYNGDDPLGDNDGDLTPNYRDSDFGDDVNSDGIIDDFDFDLDGIPNHFDLDSDNDGILDIVEAGNAISDATNNGRTNNAIGGNGLDDTLETSDSRFGNIAYTLPNTDGNGNPNFLDIDADGDGIVDVIEAQSTNTFRILNGTISALGIDTAFPNGITPVDTENDGIPDYIDTNSDDDIRLDILEAWDINSDGTAETLALNSDADNDGLDDAFDNNDNLLNQTNGQTPLDFPNADNIDNPERDWREIIAIVILIDDITVTEGEDLTFTIRFITKNSNNNPPVELIESAFPVDINFTTSNGSTTTDVYDVAIAPFDYPITNTTFTVAPFVNTATFTVSSLEDNIYELTELFSLTGTVTSNNTLTKTFTGVGSLLDNDPKPDISMNNSSEFEGVDLQHTITITNPSSTPIEIGVNTSDILAISPEDYTPILETLVIDGTIDPDNANTETSFNISSTLDNLNELDEEPLNVVGVVTTPNVSTQDLTKTATILDIDPKPLIQIDSITTQEGSFLNFTISLRNENQELMQNYLPINLTLETIDDVALAGSDYESKSKQVTIPAFTSSITQIIQTVEDRLHEGKETFFLQANLFSSEVSNTSSPRGVATIVDNDFPNLFSPNNDGRSDVFKISGLEDYPNFTLKIYNRQGNEVYNYSNNGNMNPVWWNGTNKGQPVPTGVYYYFLNFNDGVKEPITKFIQLIR
jgi:gliding motility-associated-like protein